MDELRYLDFWFRDKEYLFQEFDEYRIGKKKRRRLFFDTGGKILFVAHIDTVLPPKIHKKNDEIIAAQGLDDRLGCCLAFSLMEQFPADLLICDYEENGESTAQFHQLKRYNFIVELDRGGMDFVDYWGLGGYDFCADVTESTGMTLENGIFSDISFMKTSIGRINWGIGYHEAHSFDSYAKVADIDFQVARLKYFLRNHIDNVYKEDENAGSINYEGNEDDLYTYDKLSASDYPDTDTSVGIHERNEAWQQ
jgi:hypothetical protein